MPFSLFLALKYLKPKRSFVSVVTIISILGVIIGVAILVIVMSIMEGFDEMWRQKILGFTAHLTVSRGGHIIDPDTETARLIEQAEGVLHAAPYVETIVLMQNNNKITAPFVVGMAAEDIRRVSEIPAHITDGTFDLKGKKIVIGWNLACQLGLHAGDKVLVYSPRSVMRKDEVFLPEELTVSGLFELGMWEFDNHFALTSIDVARELYGIESGACAIRVMTTNPFRAAECRDRIMAKLGPGYQVRTWMEMNSTLFDALRVEKSVMFMLLVFIAVVAVFCVTNTLIVITVHKTNEIGLLKALGFSARKIMGVFIWHGWIQCIVGTGGGIGAGMLILHYRNHIVRWLSHHLHVDLFPAAIYLLKEIPAKTSFEDVARIAIMVIVFCTLASIIPAARAAMLNPVEAIRRE